MLSFIILVIIAGICAPTLWFLFKKDRISKLRLLMIGAGFLIASAGIYIQLQFSFYYSVLGMAGLSLAVSALVAGRLQQEPVPVLEVEEFEKVQQPYREEASELENYEIESDSIGNVENVEEPDSGEELPELSAVSLPSSTPSDQVLDTIELKSLKETPVQYDELIVPEQNLPDFEDDIDELAVFSEQSTKQSSQTETDLPSMDDGLDEWLEEPQEPVQLVEADEIEHNPFGLWDDDDLLVEEKKNGIE